MPPGCAGRVPGGRGTSGTVGMAGAVGGTNPSFRPALTARSASTVSASVGRRSGSARSSLINAPVSGPPCEGNTCLSVPSAPYGGTPSTAVNRVAPSE